MFPPKFPVSSLVHCIVPRIGTRRRILAASSRGIPRIAALLAAINGAPILAGEIAPDPPESIKQACFQNPPEPPEPRAMGAGGEHVGAVATAAAAAEGNQEVVVVGGGGGDLTRVVPWECAWPGCGKFMETGATHKFVVGHIRQHREARDEEQSRLAAREAARAMERQVKGPSCQKKNNGYKDMAAGQRAVGFIGNGGRNKGVRQT